MNQEPASLPIPVLLLVMTFILGPLLNSIFVSGLILNKSGVLQWSACLHRMPHAVVVDIFGRFFGEWVAPDVCTKTFLTLNEFRFFLAATGVLDALLHAHPDESIWMNRLETAAKSPTSSDLPSLSRFGMF